MTRLTQAERDAFRRLTEQGWVQTPAERSPGLVAPTPEARRRYCLWATEMAKLCKVTKPVRFQGDHWRL
jgi:hypothetical protein